MRAYRGLLTVALLLTAVGAVLVTRTTAFGRPGALVGLVTVSMLVLLLWFDSRWRESARRRLATPELLERMAEPSLTPALLLRGFVLVGALVLVLLAAARPKGGMGQSTLTGEGIDIVIALDVSNSMRVPDLGGVARLDMAKQLLRRFIERSDGDRIGLVAFAGSAHVMCPFTLDHGTLLTFLDDVDYGSVARQGTAVGTALREATARFDPQSEGGKLIVLLTDGEDQGSDPAGAAETARAAGVVVHTVGIGTSSGGAIPMGTDFWGNSVVKRYQGQQVVSSLDEATLKAIADTTGGAYHYADTPARLDDVLRDIASMDKLTLASKQVDMREDIFDWYLVPALLLLALEPLLALRRRRGGVIV